MALASSVMLSLRWPSAGPAPGEDRDGPGQKPAPNAALAGWHGRVIPV